MKNYDIISVKEAIWRTGWNLEESEFIKKIYNEKNDAVIMTKTGIKINCKYLIIKN
jgi:hypothetical protein